MIAKLSKQEMQDILKDNVWGHFGCNDNFNTFIYPTNYLYTGRYIICHSQNGAKIEVMRQNHRVCLQVDEVQDHRNWRSVMVQGIFQEVVEERERLEAMKAFVDRNMQLKLSKSNLSKQATSIDEELPETNSHKPVIYRILIGEMNGVYEDG